MLSLAIANYNQPIVEEMLCKWKTRSFNFNLMVRHGQWTYTLLTELGCANFKIDKHNILSICERITQCKLHCMMKRANSGQNEQRRIFIKLSTHLNENLKCLADRLMEKFISAGEFHMYFNSILHGSGFGFGSVYCRWIET